MPVGLEVTELKVRSVDVDRNEVSWCVVDTMEDVHDYTFRIYRSESPAGPFEPVSPVFEDRYLFVDSRVPISDKFQVMYYKVQVTQKSSQDTKDFGPAARTADVDLFANYIRKSELTLLTQIIGRKVWVFPRRTFGQRCTACWDPKLAQKTRAQCRECYDTGYVRGYMDPIEIYMQIDPGTKNYQLQAQQQDQQGQVTARTSFFPSLKPGDVVAELENRRWRITAVTSSQRLRAVIKQELQLREIQKTDIEFKLPLNFDKALKDIQASPSRMFTNPHNLDNLDDDLYPNAFAIYETYPASTDE